MIFRKDIGHVIRENWYNSVPILLTLARDCRAIGVVSILRSYDQTKLQEDFGKFK